MHLRISLVHVLPARGLNHLVGYGLLWLLHTQIRAAIASSWELEIDIIVIHGFVAWGWWQKQRGFERD
jgi:hypothetical protein